MIQEILTYMILGSAITLAIIKVRNKFWRKKNRNRKTNSNIDNTSVPYNCSDCAAECVLRDSFQQTIQHNKDLCNKVEIKSD